VSETRLPIERGPRGATLAYARRLRLLGLVVLGNAILIGLIVFGTQAVRHGSHDVRAAIPIVLLVGPILVIFRHLVPVLMRGLGVTGDIREATRLLIHRLEQIVGADTTISRKKDRA